MKSVASSAEVGMSAVVAQPNVLKPLRSMITPAIGVPIAPPTVMLSV